MSWSTFYFGATDAGLNSRKVLTQDRNATGDTQGKILGLCPYVNISILSCPKLYELH